MGNRTQSRLKGGLGLTFLVTILLIGVAVPALACYPVISADYVCLDDGTYRVSGHVAPWDGGGLERLTNPKIEVHRGGYYGDLVASGAFVIVGEDVPGFDWADATVFPGDVPQDVTYVVVAKADWGGSTPEAPRGPDNLHRDQTVTISLPGTCVGEEVPTPPAPTNPPTATATATVTGTIGDLVWDDANADGHQGDFEVGVAGVTVNLLDSRGVVIATTVTDATGIYLFTGLSGGTYEVQFIVPAGFEVSPLRAGDVPFDLDSDAGVAGRTGAITLASGQTDLTWDAGIFRIEVSPQVITTTSTTTVGQTAETLPVTGISSGPTGGVAVALLMLGGLVVLTIRRREQGAVIVADGWYSRLKVYDPKYQ